MLVSLLLAAAPDARVFLWLVEVQPPSLPEVVELLSSESWMTSITRFSSSSSLGVPPFPTAAVVFDSEDPLAVVVVEGGGGAAFETEREEDMEFIEVGVVALARAVTTGGRSFPPAPRAARRVRRIVWVLWSSEMSWVSSLSLVFKACNDTKPNSTCTLNKKW